MNLDWLIQLYKSSPTWLKLTIIIFIVVIALTFFLKDTISEAYNHLNDVKYSVDCEKRVSQVADSLEKRFWEFYRRRSNEFKKEIDSLEERNQILEIENLTLKLSNDSL